MPKFIDANIFIYYIYNSKDEQKLFKRSGEIIDNIIQNNEQCATSTFVISQVCAFLKNRKPSLIELFFKLIEDAKLEVVETDWSLFIEVWLIIKSNPQEAKRWDDWLIAEQMKRKGIYEIYSFDTDFDVIPGVKRIH